MDRKVPHDLSGSLHLQGVGSIPFRVQNREFPPAISSVNVLAMDRIKGPLEPGSLFRIFSLKKGIPEN
jgi:hypothetical protein